VGTLDTLWVLERADSPRSANVILHGYPTQ